ncbi:hypothetical protein ACIBH1_45020 [Nonomuraea sp. NPDC050663]|uniref:hypothetical protein n=1 Tax=Nonomuraea sp. NPDC050663 TaxID=3364370 RepID=UPI0037A8BBE9
MSVASSSRSRADSAAARSASVQACSATAPFNVADGSAIGELHHQHRAADFNKFLAPSTERRQPNSMFT